MELAILKLDVYKKLSFDILILNKAQVRRDEFKLYQQAERTKYDKLIDLMAVNLAYLDRILSKWSAKLSTVN